MNIENKKNEDIAIIGIGFRLTSGEEKLNNDSPQKFWNSLKNGFNGVIPTTERWSDNYSKLGEISNGFAGLLPFDELKNFDPLFFGISPSETSTIDPQQRLLLKTTWECLEDAGIDHHSIRGTNTSVFIGSSTTEYRESIVNPNEQYLNIFGTYAHGIANRISYAYDLRGESLTIDTACSSSGVAISLGAESIKNGKCKLSIVGGVNLIVDTTNIKAFSYLNMLSTSGVCRPFDIGSDGLIRGEGVGTIVLKNLGEAIADGNKIYCIIKGTSHNVDGNGLDDKQNFYAPSSTSQSENVKMAIASVDGGMITTDDIDYFECHGTGTPTGDPIETKGISMAFNRTKDNQLLIGSLKGSSGHSEAASGVIGVIKCCLMFKHQSLVPCVNFKIPNPLIKFDDWNLKVVTEPIPFSKLPNKLKNKPVLIAINNFGVTGGNCCLVLSEYIPSSQQSSSTSSSSPSNSSLLIPFSANSVKSMELYKERLKSSINGIDLKDSNSFRAFAKNQIFNKSKSLAQRSIVVASNWQDLLNSNNNNIIKTSNSKSSNISISKKKPITIFVFSGQGSQYHTMINQLYNDEKVFRNSIDEIDKSLFKYYGYSVYEKFKTSNLSTIHEPIIAQPGICMLLISLFELYKHWGIETSFLVGHSLGEMASAYCSGMIDLETLSYVVYHRSVAQEKTHGNGRMLSINISAEEYKSNYASKYPTLEIACYNSPTSIVVAGNESSLNQLSNELKEKEEFSAMLASQSSFHTSSQSKIKNDILNLQFNSNPPKYPIFSSVTTNLFDGSTTAFNPAYIYDNIKSPVKFSQTISNIFNHIETNSEFKDRKEIVFIELAPHPTLSFYLKQMKSTSETLDYQYSYYSPLHKSRNGTVEFQKVISQLYCENGIYINFKCQLENEINNYDNEFSLPNYQWDDQQYWKVDISHYRNYVNGPPIDILGNPNFNSPLEKSYETYIDIKRKPFQYLKGHQIKKKYYFPGTGYIDNLLKLYPSQDLIIDNIEFIAPLIFIEGVNICVQTNVYQLNSPNQYKFEYHYKDHKSYEWVKSCFGEFHLLSNHFTNQSFDIQQLIQSKCNLSVILRDDYYQMIKIKTGLDYSGSFRGVNQCYMGDNCSLIEVSMALPIDLPDQKSFFNASVLDSCTHGLLGLVEYQSQLLFQKINEFKLYNLNIPNDRTQHSSVFVYTTLNDVSNDSFSASVVILLSNGKVLIEMDNVVTKSLTPIQNPLKIEYPTNELFSTALQPKDSPIPSTEYFKSKIQQPTTSTPETIKNNAMFLEFSENFILNRFIDIIEKRTNITFKEIKTTNINQLVDKYCSDIKNERLFKFLFSTIQQQYNNVKLSLDEITILKEIDIYELIDKSTKIVSKILFPFNEDKEDPITETPSSLFENGLLDKFYNTDNFLATKVQTDLVSDIIEDSIKPILNEKIVIRILELGGGVGSLSVVLLERIDQLLIDNPLYEIDIEYTWSDISPAFIPDAEKKLDKFKNNVNIIYRSIDAEKEFIKGQSLKPSYFDFILMSNVLHAVKNIGHSLDNLYEILSPNGQLLLVEPFVSMINDSIFGSFSQWWTFEDTDFRTDRCCINPNNWLEILSKHNFKNSNSYENIGSCCYVIHSQKPSLINGINDSIPSSNNLIIIYSYENVSVDSNSNIFNNHFSNNDIIRISNITEFNELIKQSKVNDGTIIYFTKAIEQLTIDNFKPISFEYIQINQILLKNKLKSKHVLITLSSTDSNYLAASVVGAKRYFEEHNQLVLNAIDFDSISIHSINNLQSLLFELINGVKFTQNDFIIRNGKVYYERVKKESNLKLKFSSNSFEDNNLLYSKLIDSDYQLHSKQETLNENEVEVRVSATTIKQQKNNIGEFSGIISRISDITNKSFKVGDKVYGFGYDSTSSHIIVKSDWIHEKPLNLTDIESAAIPFKYLESIYGLFNICDLDEKQSILIHSDNLAILNLLKSNDHKGLIFVTVESKEKKNHLIEKYGNMICEIYWTDNINFVEQIKLKSGNKGIDLIINSTNAPHDNMDSNFKILKKNTGKILDFSNDTSLDQTIYKNCRKLNVTYHRSDLLSASKSTLLNLFEKLTNLIENNEISLLPTIDYSNSNIFDATQTMMSDNNDIHTFILENHQEIFDKQLENHSKQLDYNILKSNYRISENHLGKNIIVTGQTGIVLEILKWICKYSKNVENIIIISKSSIKWELQLLIGKTKESLENNQIKLHFTSVDVSDSNQLSITLNKVLKENNIQNIDSVFHYAFTQVTGGPHDIDLNHLNISHNAKTIGAINLHNESINRNWKLLNFVNASSTVSLAGSPDQCTYVCANSVIDSFSRYRNSIGLPSICSYYGSIKSGLVLRNEAIGVALEGQGYTNVSMNKVLGSLDLQIQNPNLSTNLIVSGFNFNIFKNNPQHSIADKFEHQINYAISKSTSNTSTINTFDSKKGVAELLISKISELLSVDVDKFNTEISLIDYGVDSLLVIQIKNWIEKEFGPNIITTTLLQNNSINSLILLIKKNLEKKK